MRASSRRGDPGVESGRYLSQRGGKIHGTIPVVQGTCAIAEQQAGHGHAAGRDGDGSRECTEHRVHGPCGVEDTVAAQGRVRIAGP